MPLLELYEFPPGWDNADQSAVNACSPSFINRSINFFIMVWGSKIFSILRDSKKNKFSHQLFLMEISHVGFRQIQIGQQAVNHVQFYHKHL